MSYKLIKKDELDIYLKELTKIIRKNNRKNDISYEIILVGGASILVNYSFRMSTSDVDCIDVNNILMNDAINVVAEKYSLPYDWINTDFKITKSYSDKLVNYSTFYKSFGNGTLIIRTIKDEYLIAMKLVSGRKYKNDLSDIIGIINEINKNRVITLGEIEKAVIELYGDLEKVNNDAYQLLKDFLSKNNVDYNYIYKLEEKNKNKLLNIEENQEILLSDDNIDYILEKIK